MLKGHIAFPNLFLYARIGVQKRMTVSQRVHNVPELLEVINAMVCSVEFHLFTSKA